MVKAKIGLVFDYNYYGDYTVRFVITNVTGEKVIAETLSGENALGNSNVDTWNHWSENMSLNIVKGIKITKLALKLCPNYIEKDGYLYAEI